MSLVKTGLRFVLGRNLANLLTTGRGYSYGGGDPLNTSDGLQSQSKLGNIKGKLKEHKSPYAYSMLHYPQEVAQLGDGHYIRIDIVENKKSRFKGTNAFKTSKVNMFTKETDTGTLGELSRVLGMAGEAEDLATTAWDDMKNTARSFTTVDGLHKLIKDGGFSVLSKGYKAKLGALNSRSARKVTSGVNFTKDGTHKTHYIPNSIMLYTPPGVEFNYKVNHEGEDTGFAGTISEVMKSGISGSPALMAGLGKLVTGAVGAVMPGLEAMLQKETGMATNERQEMVFQNVGFREFTFKYQFAPKNKSEQEQIEKIIHVLKFHMHPELTMNNEFFVVPSEFVLTYMYREKENSYIPMISRCALVDMKVNYSPKEVFTTYAPDENGAFPTITEVDLQFKEMEIMTKSKIMGEKGRGY